MKIRAGTGFSGMSDAGEVGREAVLMAINVLSGEQPVLVTRSEGIEIKEFGGRLAAEVNKEQSELPPDELSSENFWSTSIHHPFNLIQSDGSILIRIARAKTPDGTLRIQGCVPPTGSVVQVKACTHDSLLSIVNDEAGTALQKPPEAGILLAFSCATKALDLGNKKPEESRHLQEVVGDSPAFWFYCCGEFARTSGVLETLNGTLTAFALQFIGLRL